MSKVSTFQSTFKLPEADEKIWINGSELFAARKSCFFFGEESVLVQDASSTDAIRSHSKDVAAAIDHNSLGICWYCVYIPVNVLVISTSRKPASK